MSSKTTGKNGGASGGGGGGSKSKDGEEGAFAEPLLAKQVNSTFRKTKLAVFAKMIACLPPVGEVLGLSLDHTKSYYRH